MAQPPFKRSSGGPPTQSEAPGADGRGARREDGLFRHILVVADAEPAARRAVQHGLDLAEALDAALTFVAVAPDCAPKGRCGADCAPDEDGSTCGVGQADEAMASAERQALERGRRHSLITVVDDDPETAIATMARVWRCHLIVMASHRHDEPSEPSIGRLAQAVIGKTPLPVVVVPKTLIQVPPSTH
jgi:nucleotide-binding universal stress UspA family protein